MLKPFSAERERTRQRQHPGKQQIASGVAGTMAANGSGLQWATVRTPKAGRNHFALAD
ncbi:hypothetical protein [Mesorhizobium sp. M7A.F.Ca.US.008.03.1.1]|uniref:hypothetical protein n=1 Tax=Mesorhizobium sp. M7A.F.Ca.US.008.03.1.1 TaxID=2496742 RepID=UPI0013E090B2|nr:hypothetical protein [Mesorhizobium sp. M7A.F.Ca.US.008.03.1.1]